jgi:hypothetical protein
VVYIVILVLDMKWLILLALLCLQTVVDCSPSDDLLAAIGNLRQERKLKGIQVQVSKDDKVVFDVNLGYKN